MLIQNRGELRPKQVRFVLVKTENYMQDCVTILLLLQILKLCVNQASLKLIQEVLVSAKMLTDKEGIIFKNSIIVDD